MNEKLMIKGFNDGYLLQEHEPELTRTLIKGFSDKEDPYAKSFSEGAKEKGKEQYFDRIKSESLSDSNELDHSKGLDPENDRDLSL